MEASELAATRSFVGLFFLFILIFENVVDRANEARLAPALSVAFDRADAIYILAPDDLALFGFNGKRDARPRPFLPATLISWILSSSHFLFDS